jgi:8-oxo-dGTP pyrophosphatase MutT (NUDIX family)
VPPTVRPPSQRSARTVVAFAMFRLGAFAVILDEAGDVLLCHRRDLDVWNLPGGRVEQGESPWQAAVRETREEVGSRGRAQHQTAHSQVMHAELQALLSGGEALWTEYKRAILVSTMEPCPMCLGAAVMADVPHIVFAYHDV